MERMTLDEVRPLATITVEEAASLLGVSRDVAYDAIKWGQIPCLRVGRRVVVPVPALLALLSGAGAEVAAVDLDGGEQVRQMARRTA